MSFEFKMNCIYIFYKILIKLKHLYYNTLCYCTPVKKNKIAFCCHVGRSGINCNPKYILKELIKQNLPYEYVWICNKEFFQFDDEFKNVKFVDFKNNKEKIKELSSSKIWVENIYKIVDYKAGLIKKKNQFYLNTWHGSLGIKKMYHDVKTYKPSEEYKKYFKKNFDDCNLLLTNSEWEEDVFKGAFRYKGKMSRVGHPRNDVFFSENNLKEKIYEKYNILKESKLALYCPSFRDSLKIDCYDLDYKILKETLKQKFGGEWVIATRFHPTNLQKPELLKKISTADIDLTYHPDMQELLVSADVIVSDYSSCMFDFLLTKKPCFIYATDIEEYKLAERDFYYSIYQTPFMVSSNNKELKENILNFDCSIYKDKCEKFLEEKKAMDDGFASKRVAEIIKKIIRGENV